MDGKIGGCAGFPALSPRPLSGGLGRKQLSLSLLLVAFHRFRGFLRASRDSLCGGHCSQAWRPFPSASSAGVSFMLWPLRAAFRVRGANRPRGDFVLAGFSQAGISEVSPVNGITSLPEQPPVSSPSTNHLVPTVWRHRARYWGFRGWQSRPVPVVTALYSRDQIVKK